MKLGPAVKRIFVPATTIIILIGGPLLLFTIIWAPRDVGLFGLAA